jgi:peptide methionine sulfoxide reductase MsrB
MAVARARIAAAISLSRASYHKSGKYSATAGWPSLVDEAETTEVEMTHD